MKYQVAVLGDRASVIAFRGLGFHVVTLEDDKQAERELYRLIDSEKFAIIYITEPMAKRCERILQRYQNEVMPAIIPIPASYHAGSYALTNLRESVIRAVGFDVLANNKESGEKNEN